MRRWNGWGDDSIDVPLAEHARALFAERIGPGVISADATLEKALQGMPDSRLPEHRLISRQPEDRLRHAVADSFSDWVAKRAGNIEHFPDGVAWPDNRAEVRELLDWAGEHNIAVIPWGGGTSVVGHLTPIAGGRPVLTVNMSHMNQLIDIDELSLVATIGAGASGPEVEEQLKARGYVLGHLPQSWEYSTLGGWVAARSSGQQSYRYGRIEGLLAGAHVETPNGPWDIPTIPATGAGTDPREILLGSEGRIGIITEVKVRVQRAPEMEKFYGVFFPSWSAGEAALREIAQQRIDVSMLRLSNENEAISHLALAGKPKETTMLQRYLALRGVSEGMCYAIFGLTGSKADCRPVKRRVLGIMRQHGGINTGTVFGKAWAEKRFRGAYIRNGMWDAGYAIDTFETALDWPKVEPYMRAAQVCAEKVFTDMGEKALVFAHLSHVYQQGSTVYTSCIFRLADNPAETLARWQAFKKAVSTLINEHGGTISHQHGVGLDHQPYLATEKGGEQGLNAIRHLVGSFDPQGIMNPGKLVS